MRWRTVVGLTCARWLAGFLASVVQVVKKTVERIIKEKVKSFSCIPFLDLWGQECQTLGTNNVTNQQGAMKIEDIRLTSITRGTTL